MTRGAARQLAEAARGVRYAGEATVTTLDLMASKLGSAGPTYMLLAAIPLGSA
jgi:hypothetical protein